MKDFARRNGGLGIPRKKAVNAAGVNSHQNAGYGRTGGFGRKDEEPWDGGFLVSSSSLT